MADNVTDTNGNIFATDQQAGTLAHHPISKLAHGALDTFTLVSVANPLPVTLGAATTFSHGLKTAIGTTAVQIVSANTPAIHGVWVHAHPNNPGPVYVGSSSAVTANGTAATDGWPMYAGNNVFFNVNNANLLWSISTVAANSAYWRTV